jgi:membrane peptidoglycan carboxypeptidase
MRTVWRIFRFVFSSVWLGAVTVVGVPIVAAATILAGLIFLPLPATIPIPRANPAVEPTVIYDQSGQVIATLRQYDSNVPVTEAQIPQVLKEAVVADEDRNFYKHGGVDIESILRAAWADIRNDKTVQGGSTITQQYVKLAYTNGDRTVQRKVREAILAGQLDREASKDEILYRYLTTVYFGDGNYGIGAAAQNYFHVPVNKLNASQAAALAGLIPAPTARALREHIGTAEKYRELVLGKMLAQGYLTSAQYHADMAQKLALATGTSASAATASSAAAGSAAAGTPGAGTTAAGTTAAGTPGGAVPAAAAPAGTAPAPAPPTLVYPVPTSTSQYPDFVDYVTRWLLAHYPASEVYGGGLKVQTTLDPAIQADASAAVASTLSGTADPLEMSLVSVQPQTGFVEAVVGGRAFGQAGAPYENDNFAISSCDFSTAGLDSPAQAHALATAKGVQASATVPATCWNGNDIDNAGTDGRQPGSSWKPFVLATAFEQGIPPTATYDGPAVYDIPNCKVLPGQAATSCQIHNDETDETGTFTLASAMAASVNTVYAQVAPQVGCANVATLAKSLGVESAYWSPSEFPYCQTYALGESDVSPLDMASAYGVFDDHGQRAAPTPILEIVNGAGKVLVNNISQAPATAPVMPANVADNVTKVLQGVLASGGTASAHALAGREAAGKTGTTSNETNAWFTGYTPTLSTSVWMGYADSQSHPLGTIKGVNPVVGGTWPAATWQAFMTAALAGVPATSFDAPAPIVPPTPVPAVAPTTTTTVPVPSEGPASPVSPTPLGAPSVGAAPTVVAPEPATTTTTEPPTTTTVPPSTTLAPVSPGSSDTGSTTTSSSTSTTSTTTSTSPP